MSEARAPDGIATLFPAGLSDDTLLGGTIRLMQPIGGYRAAIDPVVLAASVPAVAGQTAIDVGAGAGAVALALAKRVAGLAVTGMEIDGRLARLARHNAGLNGLSDRVGFHCGDVLAPPDEVMRRRFDHVVMNPPYLESGKVTVSSDPMRLAANVEGEARLADWIGFAFRVATSGGTISLIHRADRLPDILVALTRRQAGGVSVLPLWPRAEAREARRVIVRCRVGDGSRFCLTRGLVLHDALGGFTPAASAVLRDAAPIVI